MTQFVEDDELAPGEETADKSLSQYLQNIALITDMDENVQQTDVVSLMSVHAAKGLEFRSVFIVGLEENLFPSYLSLSDPNQLDEERRLFYVAITRAKENLTLTDSNSRYQYGQMRFNDPSRFIEEIPTDNVDSIITLRSQPDLSVATPKVLGNFKPLASAKRKPLSRINPQDFEPSRPEQISAGMKVMHLKFGEGEVLDIDERKVATIYFEQIVDNPKKRIMLQYAKLQILNN